MGQTCCWARIRWAKGESRFFPLLDHATPALGRFGAGCMAGSVEDRSHCPRRRCLSLIRPTNTTRQISSFSSFFSARSREIDPQKATGAPDLLSPSLFRGSCCWRFGEVVPDGVASICGNGEGDDCVRWWWGMAKMRAYGSMKGLGSRFGCEDDGTMAAAGKGHLWELLGRAKGGSVWVCKRAWA
ncbi:hypothetical protein V6N11_000320 [Hibiscus sabdariffa]|uniref:Uncharacterized protein n=1 Tax=Hibiscus sabdariffa TaxID=183260 RepID=A0ABR2NJB0_9ROSI